MFITHSAFSPSVSCAVNMSTHNVMIILCIYTQEWCLRYFSPYFVFFFFLICATFRTFVSECSNLLRLLQMTAISMLIVTRLYKNAGVCACLCTHVCVCVCV